MSARTIDFRVAERTLQDRLRELKLAPRLIDEGVDTGHKGLTLRRANTKVLQVDADDGPGKTYFVSLEVAAEIDHPSLGKHEIRDLVTLQGDQPEATIAQCANTYMDVTFPALRSLYTDEPAPGTKAIPLSSFTPALGKAIEWKVFTGKLQTIEPQGRLLAARLKIQFPLLLVFDALTGYLAQPCLHWCKVYGASKSNNELTFGCSIDGVKSFEAEAEMHKKFVEKEAVPGDWEFRQFLALYPSGLSEQETAVLLKQKASELLSSPRKKGWWSWLKRS